MWVLFLPFVLPIAYPVMVIESIYQNIIDLAPFVFSQAVNILFGPIVSLFK